MQKMKNLGSLLCIMIYAAAKYDLQSDGVLCSLGSLAWLLDCAVFDISCLILTYKTSLSTILFSLLHSLDPDTATAEQLKEAFCRLVSPRKKVNSHLHAIPQWVNKSFHQGHWPQGSEVDPGSPVEREAGRGGGGKEQEWRRLEDLRLLRPRHPRHHRPPPLPHGLHLLRGQEDLLDLSQGSQRIKTG